MGSGVLWYVPVIYGEAGEASWVQSGYGLFKLRHVMAGLVRFVLVRRLCLVVSWLGRQG